MTRWPSSSGFLAVEERTTVQALLEEALDGLFASRGQGHQNPWRVMEPNLAIAHGRIFLKGCWKDFVRPSLWTGPADAQANH